MKKKIVSLVLLTTLVVSMISGCGGSSASESTGGKSVSKDNDGNAVEVVESKDVTDDMSKSQTITVWLAKDDYKIYDSYSENPVVTYLNDKFNCKLDFQQPAMGSEQEQFSLMLGTGSYTDVMEVSYCQESVISLYDDGIIRDLAPYIEKNMPNFYAFMNKPENADIKQALYDNEGHFLTIPYQVRLQDELRWGGLVYRRDILDTMTGGFISFPSGNENPTTIEDWDYMLPLMQMYFQAAGMTDYAPLILPSDGFFTTSELLTGFGIGGDFYVEDDTVKYGPTEEGFYNYLQKMKEWYAAGYIYNDFASRTNDLFYLPNTALTYGGAAGTWFGLVAQLDDAMSLPEYGLIVDVKPISSPLDTATTDKLLAVTGLEGGRAAMNSQGFIVSTSCSEEKLLRFLSVCDYLFTDEGAMLRSYGLTADQGASSNKYYHVGGLDDGAYSLVDGVFTYDEKMVPNTGEYSVGGTYNSYVGMRLPGLLNNEYSLQFASESSKIASAAWKGTGRDNNYPGGIMFTVEDSTTKSNDYTNYHDYLVTMVPKFIMGTEELTKESFDAFVAKMDSLGVAEAKEINQRYYDEFMNK